MADMTNAPMEIRTTKPVTRFNCIVLFFLIWGNIFFGGFFFLCLILKQIHNLS